MQKAFDSGRSAVGMPVSAPEGRNLGGKRSLRRGAVFGIICPWQASLKLDDGSDIYASNMGLGGALEEIGAAISDTDTRLARWLVDVAKRPGGLMDFDLRGLNPASRAAFWLGVDRADAKFSDWDQDASFSHTVGVIRLFGERREAREKPSQERVPDIDLDEIWFDGETA